MRRTTAIHASPEPRDRRTAARSCSTSTSRPAEDATSRSTSRSRSAATASWPCRSRAPDRFDGTRVSSDDQLFNRILERSLDDLELLRSELDGHAYYSAGVPWFATLFGRDSLITAFETLSFVPGVAEETLRLLAGRLGREYDDERDEEPGKVLHELRVGEPATLGETPFARYYGSVDATPLFLCLLGQLRGLVRATSTCSASCASRRIAALDWIDRYGDLDGDGLVEYRRRSTHGLETQGWKDSADGIPDEAGEPLDRAGRARGGPGLRDPRQAGDGAHVRAATATARVPSGCAARPPRSRPQLERFWLAEPGCYAIGLDADKRPGSGLTSNQGHLLWADAVGDERAQLHPRRADGRRTCSRGWGVSTLAQSHPSYNPVGYHTGSVWPHDSALIAFGLRRYGFDEDFTLIFEGLLEAASRFDDYRLPELFAGFARAEFDEPVPYPVACQPQAWAAGSIPYLLKWGLGLSPDAMEKRLRIVRPSLPRWLRARRRDRASRSGTPAWTCASSAPATRSRSPTRASTATSRWCSRSRATAVG